MHSSEQCVHFQTSMHHPRVYIEGGGGGGGGANSLL